MNYKITYPGREVTIVHGDLEIELEMSVDEFNRIEEEVHKHDHQPLLVLKIITKDVEGYIKLRLHNLELHK